MIEKITDQNLERYDSRLKEWCDRKFFEKGNYGKYQTTEEASAVAFYPAPNTPLEGKVKFSFKETMPVEGVKGPNNPSTITGVSNITVTHCESEGVDSTDYTISFGNTYYGGEIDLATGVMTVTHICDTFTSCTGSWFYGGFSQTVETLSFQVGGSRAHLVADGILVSNMFLIGNGDIGINKIAIRGSESSNIFKCSIVKNALDLSNVENPVTLTQEEAVTVVNTFLSQNPLKVVYNPTIPFTVQLSPIEILSLSQSDKYTPRLNTVYTDADSIQISYLKSPIRDEYEKTQAILSLGGNS